MSDENHVEAISVAAPARRTFLGCGGCVWGVVGVLLLVGLLLPAISPCREAARRTQCRNNLKQIGLAMNNYHAKYGCFPPAYVADPKGRRMHSWRVLLLEFLDPDLYKRYHINEPWDSRDNFALVGEMKNKGPYYCPSDSEGGRCDTDYVMFVGPNAISNGPKGRKKDAITDDLDNTIIVAEMSHSGIYWTEPRDLNVSEMSFQIGDRSRPAVRSEHPTNIANVLLANGSVRSVFSEHLSPTLLKALITINGGKDVREFIDW